MDQHVATNEKAKEFLGNMRKYVCTLAFLFLWVDRLADGIATPLAKLSTIYKTMVDLQGDAMAEAPDRLT